MLTATESTSVFHETPSFAWNPASGAVRYELQISQSPTFQENGIYYDNKKLLTPVAAPSISLPWITGNPHSLYARVRAILAGGATTPWSADYGFDVVPPAPPTSLSSYNGLLRWAPVQGATDYDVWLVDLHRIESVNTNVFDLREYFDTQQAGSDVRWRVRAVRWDNLGLLNGVPVATRGAWSPIYTASTSAVTDAPIQLVGTVSESFSNGSASSSAHKLMPAFIWTGNEGLDGSPASLFRVEVFTDSSCLNRVWTGATVASPAYAPRLFGSVDNTQMGPDYSADGETLTPNETLAAAVPTTSVSGTKDTINIDPSSNLGAALDLWDQSWPSSGYYWTVMPVVEGTDGGYYDAELPQDVCAAGRVQRFGIASEPLLTAGNGSIFASGLSASGRLVTAKHSAKFYGQPLVAWTPAINSSAYELQVSKKPYPFHAVLTHLTMGTSLVLNLKPGTWYYRVRGFDYNLPTGSQAMAWSSPTKIVVARPKLHVAG